MTGYRPGDNFSLGFTTQSLGGAATNADALPTGSMRHNGATDGGVAITVSNNGTGDYFAAGTIPLTYAEGDDVELLVAATVGGVAGKAVLPMGKLARWAQDAARAVLAASGTVWHISTTGNDTSDGKGWKTAFATLAKAAGVAAAGDAIYVGPGTFALGATQLNVPPGVMLAGSGMDRTVLTSTYGATCVRVNSNCILQDLTVQGILAPGLSVYQYPIGDSSFAASNVVLRRVRTIGDTDGLYFSAASSVYGYGLRLTSNWDCVYNQGAIVELFDTELRTTGPNSAAPNSHGTAQCVSGGILRLTRCVIFSDATNSNPSRQTYGIRTDTGGMAELADVQIFLNVPDGTIYDLKADANGSASAIRVAGCQYNTARTLGTIFTVTADVLAPAQSFNNAGQTTALPTSDSPTAQKMATTLENDPAHPGSSRLTQAALANAPAGGGTGTLNVTSTEIRA